METGRPSSRRTETTTRGPCSSSMRSNGSRASAAPDSVASLTRTWCCSCCSSLSPFSSLLGGGWSVIVMGEVPVPGLSRADRYLRLRSSAGHERDSHVEGNERTFPFLNFSTAPLGKRGKNDGSWKFSNFPPTVPTPAFPKLPEMGGPHSHVCRTGRRKRMNERSCDAPRQNEAFERRPSSQPRRDRPTSTSRTNQNLTLSRSTYTD